MVHKPEWFRDGLVYVSFAPTIGINKDGDELFVVNLETGTRTSEIDDQIAKDVDRLVNDDETTITSRWVPADAMTERLLAVPVYFDERPLQELGRLMMEPDMAGFSCKTIAELLADGSLQAMPGHGSPSSDLRTGQIPYIKVSDIRAGQVNINPANRVSEIIARSFWKGPDSGIRAYDLITPIRTSKNIGEFAVLMPGQERMVVTKEVLILRASDDAVFDNFYLLWAMTLKAVRQQWNSIVFMQTNREDAGSRYREIHIPIPPTRETAKKFSQPFRDYYMGTHRLRDAFLQYLSADDRHYIFMSSATVVDDEDLEDAD
ncbi:MAG: hypothetical protein ACRDNW_24565 [Trebonia sp.]